MTFLGSIRLESGSDKRCWVARTLRILRLLALEINGEPDQHLNLEIDVIVQGVRLVLDRELDVLVLVKPGTDCDLNLPCSISKSVAGTAARLTARLVQPRL